MSFWNTTGKLKLLTATTGLMGSLFLSACSEPLPQTISNPSAQGGSSGGSSSGGSSSGGTGGVNPPTIVQNLTGALTRVAGQSVNLGDACVFASGNTLSYAWYFGANRISAGSASENCLVLTNLQPSATGVYYVVITNTLNGQTNSVNSAPLALTVNPNGSGSSSSGSSSSSGGSSSSSSSSSGSSSSSSSSGSSSSSSSSSSSGGGTPPPVAILNPDLPDKAISEGANLGAGEFCVTVTNGTILHYQWFFKGSPIASAASARCYTLNNAQAANAGQYFVRVTNSFVAGGATSTKDSRIATLSVNPPVAATPVITQNLANFSLVAGADLVAGNFCVTATGANLSYQWYFGGTAISGGPNARCYTLASVPLAKAGQYKVRITNTVGSSSAFIDSATATLTVTEPVETLRVVATGTFEGCGPYCGYSANEGEYIILATLSSKTNMVKGQLIHICRYPWQCSGEVFSQPFEVGANNPFVQISFGSLTINGGTADIAQWEPNATGDSGCLSVYRTFAPFDVHRACFSDVGAVPITTEVAPVIVKGLKNDTYRNLMGDPLTTSEGGGLCVVAAGTNIKFEWKVNGVINDSETSPCFNPPDDTVGIYSGTVTVRVYNSSGSATSTATGVTIVPYIYNGY